MSRLRSGLRLGCWATACIFAAPALRAADVFFAPRLTLAAGYDDNRFGAASALTNGAQESCTLTGVNNGTSKTATFLAIGAGN